MAATGKDVIYIDIDDEITAIIDKLRTSEGRIAALVLPKRATVFQSSVNMKLLKKAADESKKRLVLITSEANLMPLASSIGLYVAKNLQSKPEIPSSPELAVTDEAIDTLEGPDIKEPEEDFNKTNADGQPVGELAGLAEDSKKAKPELTPIPIPRSNEPDETVELDNTPVSEDEPDKKPDENKKPKDKNLKVPNFNKFRTRLILAALVLVVLIVGWILANIILPKATITISTQTSAVNSNLTIILNTSASSVNQTSLTLPAHSQQEQKAISQSVSTTGQVNNGTPATGAVTMVEYTNCVSLPQTIPAHIGISSTNNITFITQSAATFSTKPSGFSNGECEFNSSNQNGINVTAQSPGVLGSNLPSSGSGFTVSDTQVSAAATASVNFTDGTNNFVQTVAQADINNATTKLSSPDTSSIKTELQNGLSQAGFYPILATFNAGSPATTTSANVGSQASTVTVTQTTAYTMFGVRKTDLQSLLDNSINGQIDASKQSILSDGLNQAIFTVTNPSASPEQVTLQASATIGPNLNVTTLKTQVAGKKIGQVESLISSDPGVSTVQVHLSPFWVSGIPNKTGKITIILQNASHASKT